ncbi:hypothetical protein L249_0436 [Ophiocordyceps polyrhachis-furcata BCC 54312]|uniref:Uncharacterized protein n=1 Tax=Ophiocordyceps polyrhachis-furcata BCC 54312 TaxID=1330021 RepID=A0A367LDF5_9HYPO|nr:hypothetical protein L249_0436 [Ophiocordyceps polyrhachis-furcata BCC 54312]
MSHRARRPDEARLPVDSSWRMVEGEHDSFDTTILSPDEIDLVPSGQQPASSSFSVPSQLSSQRSNYNTSFASQDSIRDFATHQDDDHVILREPFRPSMLITPRNSRSGSAKLRTPDPQFRMPMLDVDDSSAAASSATVLPPDNNNNDVRKRRRPSSSLASPTKTLGRRRRPTRSSEGDESDGPATTSATNLLTALPRTLYRLCAWIGDVVVIAMAYAKYPLGALLAVYLVCGSFMLAQNMATRSLHSAVSPLCQLPGVSLLRLPFCPSAGINGSSSSSMPHGSVEFDDLMGVQSQFEQVLERATDAVSLPFEMKRSETAVRDLRSLVSHSDIQGRHELVLEFDGYIALARRIALDLQRFNAHVGSSVDAVISINRWTSRYIDSLAPSSSAAASSSSASEGASALIRFSSWLFSPFSLFPASTDHFSERAILDQYMEHTSLVSDRIANLIVEAQALLRLLTKAEDHLSLIYDIASRSSALAASRREELLWTIWTLVGANSARLSSLSRQLGLLRRVDAQRSSAVSQLSALILDLESIQARLSDLRDSVADPRLAAAAGVHIPLAVHIQTIDRGVERLEGARSRLRVAEEDRVRDALSRAASQDDRLIDARQQ